MCCAIFFFLLLVILVHSSEEKKRHYSIFILNVSSDSTTKIPLTRNLIMTSNKALILNKNVLTKW
ncbi:hypothetical protein AAHE18_20G147900 [Arachis hypogaea]